MQYDNVTTNPIWRTAAMLKIVFWLLSPRFIVRLTRNLVLWSTIMFRHRSSDQINNFRKFKMADGRHFEISFIAITQPRIARFQWNLVFRTSAADFGYKDGRTTKYQDIVNSKWRTAAILKIVFWLYLWDLLSD